MTPRSWCERFQLWRISPIWRRQANTLTDHRGAVRAFYSATAKQVWEWSNDKPTVASVLATGGDLVFAGEPTGEFNPYDACTGGLLWQHQTGSGHHKPDELHRQRKAVQGAAAGR